MDIMQTTVDRLHEQEGKLDTIVKSYGEGKYSFKEFMNQVENVSHELMSTRMALEKEIEYSKDKILDSWCIDDVYSRAEELEIKIDDDKAREILHAVQDNMDANVGINWDTIDYWLQELTQ